MGQLCDICTRSETDNNQSPDEFRKISKNSKNDELVRFFMAGLGSAGKSTIIRQLQYLCSINSNYKMCNEDWIPIQKREVDSITWQRTIRRNILDLFDIFIKQAHIDGETLAKDLTAFAKSIEEACQEKEDSIDFIEINEDFRRKLIELFNDNAIKNVLKKKNKISIDGKTIFDGCDYFLTEEKIREIFSDDYEPSAKDKVHSRNPTVDMHTYRFKLNETRIEICDVGGQKAERMKITDYLKNWSFASTERDRNFILLVVSMSDYNVPHPQYQGTLLDECVEYMKVLLNNSVAQKCGLFIFFNKKDRFKEKLEDEECRADIKYLKRYLTERQVTEYQTAGRFKSNDMSKAIASKFVDALDELNQRRKNTYCRYTCAVDSKMMEGIFGAIKDEIINEQLLSIFP